MKITVIAGSAGALEVVQQIFSAHSLPRNLSYIVILHLSPDSESHIDSLLTHWSSMPVTVVSGKSPVKIGNVYVCKPGHYLRMDGDILLIDSEETTHPRMPIDHFLLGLSQKQCSETSAVILSGSLNDGTKGSIALKQHGGVVIVQSPESAKFSSMPDHVIKSGSADQILDVTDIPNALINWAKLSEEQAAANVGSDGHDIFTKILDMVHIHSMNDMSGYKPSTLRRRIDRRISMHHLRSMGEYLELLRQSPAELDRLAKDMFIGVTSFFRDSDAFAIIEQNVTPAILSSIEENEPLRVWVAGCSTGEEVYSIAILLHESFAKAGIEPRIQIFATDVDEAALDIARSGLYSTMASDKFSKDRLDKYFSATTEGIKIKKTVRESIVFASHNLISDPPFSKLDLVVCRNVLIYLNAATQKKLFSLFRFILKPGGFLFLGSSESIGSMSRYFKPVSKQWRIYQLTSSSSLKKPPQLPMAAIGSVRRTTGGGEIAAVLGALAGQEKIFRALIENHGPAQIIVDNQHQVLYVAGGAGRYLEYPHGEPSQDLFKIVQHKYRVALRSSLQQAQRKMARTVAIAVDPDRSAIQEKSLTRITSIPVSTHQDDCLFLVVIDEEPASHSVLPATSDSGDAWLLQQLEQEINATREDLQRTIERMRSQNEEVKASNEEVMAMNEELQSANEELESSKEELQSLNEELSTTNNALDSKVNELEVLNTDLNNLLLSSETATIFLDNNLKIRRFTPACVSLMRLIQSDIGRSIADIVQDTTDSDLVGDCKSALSGSLLPDKQIRNNYGKWFLRRVLPYRNRDGAILGLVLTYPDISAVKEGESELLKRSEQLEWQAELLKEASVLARDMNDRIIYWNVGAENLYGWTSNEALGSISHELLKSHFDKSLAEIKAEVLNSNSWYGRISHQHKDGTTTVVDSHWVLHRDENGKASSIVEVNTDITQRLAAEIELDEYRHHLEEMVKTRTNQLELAKKAAESANIAKRAFLANMSHEIRTPLNALMGLAHLIRDAGLNQQQSEHMDKLDSASEHLLEIINAILDLSKIEAEKFEIKEGVVDIRNIVNKISDFVRPKAVAKQLILETEIGPVPENVLGDTTRLQQALLNYASNAVKFTDKGKITLRARIEEDREKDVLVRFEVQDTGIGIAAITIPRLFADFEQGDNTLTREYGGTGLGLAITKKIAQLTGGDAGVNSQLGIGSTFWFTTRLKKSEPRSQVDILDEKDAKEILLREHKDARILIVEDDAVNRMMFREILALAGLKSEEARDGLEAIEIVKNKAFDLILMDMQMPRLDGMAATQKIRNLHNGENVPIIALTGNAFDENRGRCLSVGMNDFITKPLKPDLLYETILRWLRQSKQH